jgi:transcriptional regulator with XRE-family HTH domain
MIISNDKIGKRIRELRIKRGMTQEELARAVGYNSPTSKSTINKIESGHSDIAQSKIRLYADALGVSVSDLLDLDDDEALNAQSPDDILAFALFGDSSVVTPEDLEDIRKFADYIKQRRDSKNDRD